MTKEKDHKDVLEQVRRSMPDEVPEMLNHKMKAMLAGFRQDLEAHPWLHRGSRRRGLPLAPAWRRMLLVTGTGAACLVAVLMVLLANRTPSWAEVEQRFSDIDFCAVSVYHRYEPFGRPTFAQYWFGRDGRARIHSGRSVAFLAPGAPIKVYDLKTRGKGYTDMGVKEFLRTYERARQNGAPTLVSIMEALAGEGLQDTTGLQISDAEVAKDLLVFDAATRDTLWRLRVWALRESMLPIRIIKWHQTHGRHTEMVFNYAAEQDGAFFDPGVFAEKLNDPNTDNRYLREMFSQFPGSQVDSEAGNQ